MTRSIKTLAAALLAGTALSTAAWAQFGGGGPMVPPAAPQGMPMPTGGGPNVPTGGMPGGGMPGGGAPMGGANGSPFTVGRLPFANGTVTTVDAAAGTVTLTPMFGGGSPQTVRVTGATQITATREGSVGDLKVGDAVQVRGVPTGIVATSITAGAPDVGGGGPGPVAGLNGGLDGPMGAGRGRQGGPPAAFAQASGRVTALSPLTVSVAEGVSVTLRVRPDAKVSRNVPEKIGDLRVGDRVMANGQAGDDGVLAASRLRVNADYGLGLGTR